MTMEMRPGRYVSQIYFAGGGVPFDVMGFLYRDPGKPFELLCRFRYYDGDQSKGPFGDGDSKRWTVVVFERKGEPASEIEAMQFCSNIFNALVENAPGMELTVLPVRTDDSTKILRALRDQPWAHMKDATPEHKP